MSSGQDHYLDRRIQRLEDKLELLKEENGQFRLLLHRELESVTVEMLACLSGCMEAAEVGDYEAADEVKAEALALKGRKHAIEAALGICSKLVVLNEHGLTPDEQRRHDEIVARISDPEGPPIIADWP